MASQLPRNNSKRARAPFTVVSPAKVTTEVVGLVGAAMKLPSFPANFVPPMPSRPTTFPNVAVEDHTASYQASFLQIRRPMSASFAKWVVGKFEKACLKGPVDSHEAAVARELPSYSVALEMEDAYLNLGRTVPPALAAHSEACRKAQARDAKLKLETRVVYGPVVMGHSQRPLSAVVTALPPLSGKTYVKWDAMCREVCGKTVGLSALLAPATIVHNNMGRGAAGLRQHLLENAPDGVAEPPKKRARVSEAGEHKLSPGESGESSVDSSDDEANGPVLWPTCQWVNCEWMREAFAGKVSYFHKDSLPPLARSRALKLPPRVPADDAKPAAKPAAIARIRPRTVRLAHDLMLPAGETIAPRPSAPLDWRTEYSDIYEV